MAEYIERKAAIDALDMLSDKMTTGGQTALQQGIDLLKDMYTVDVAPVVHGAWIWEEPNSANRFRGCFLCNKCFESMYTKKNFCPNCGADMGSDIII